MLFKIHQRVCAVVVGNSADFALGPEFKSHSLTMSLTHFTTEREAKRPQ
jgi:hypothetical protein